MNGSTKKLHPESQISLREFALLTTKRKEEIAQKPCLQLVKEILLWPFRFAGGIIIAELP